MKTYTLVEQDGGSYICRPVRDPVVAAVIIELIKRSEGGFEKYNTSLAANKDFDLAGWLQHAKEELLDGALYLQRSIQEKQIG